MTGLRWEANQTQNRHFLVLALARPPCNGLNRLLAACNEVAAKFGQPTLYNAGSPTKPNLLRSEGSGKGQPSSQDCKKNADPLFDSQQDEGAEALKDVLDCFHVSIAWSLATPGGDRPDTLNLNDKLGTLEVPISTVKIKIGNQVSSISLGNNDMRQKGRKWLQH